jgi:adenylate kinase
LILLLFGPPGCGKGTQAAKLAQRFGIPAISTGEMFRAECQTGSELGRKVSEVIRQGHLVPDDIVDAMVASRTARPDCVRGFLLDGYPRTVSQARSLSALLSQRKMPEPVVIYLDVSESRLVERLTARRQCPECRRIYNVITQPPKVEGLCNEDRAPLITRDDDCECVIRRRLQAYAEETGPVLKWYGTGCVHRIDADCPPDVVSKAIGLELSRILASPPNVALP